MGPPAQNPTSFLLWDICFYGNGIGTNDWSTGTTLTLDFSTLGISHLAFDEGALGVFATVAIRIPCRVDSLEADARGWFSTWSPECDTLLLVGLADAIVAVTIHSLTRVPIMKVHIGWAVRGSSCTEFWEVTGIAGGSACSSWRLQLAVLAALPMRAHSIWLQSAGAGVTAAIGTFLWFPAVTLFSLFHVAISTLPAPKGLLDLWQVEEAHPHPLLQASLQVLPATAAEHHGEREPGGRVHDAASFVCRHSAATAPLQGVMVHSEIVA